MNEELERWLRIKAECEDVLDKYGSILEAVTDRGQPVLRKNPAVETLMKAETKIDELQKHIGSGLDLD